ncbi:hypothetical protein HPB48_013107 [Haemaphysalis longicornis]|uniref:Uncharacterized protein n=1 Tax=Haemaphysalis longicornis TaxID=44386 RepID=A0A9J6GZB4_HAELO|nr:hypothetical protein HPB48_013107 [Haemaphysalis longicornis]
MDALATRTEMVVKGKRCLVINPNRREAALKVHWLPQRVPDELIVRKLETLRPCFLAWCVTAGEKSSFAHTTGTSRVYHIMPSRPTSLENIPHHATVQGCPILIEVAGRPALCLRCFHTRDYRRSCQTPLCRSFRSFCHDHANCTLSYAARTKPRSCLRLQLEQYMDADDMAALMGTTSQEAGEALPFPSLVCPVEVTRTTKFLSPTTVDATWDIDGVPQTQSTLPSPPLCVGGAHGTALGETPAVGEEEQQLVGNDRREENSPLPSGASKMAERKIRRMEATRTTMSPQKRPRQAARKRRVPRQTRGTRTRASRPSEAGRTKGRRYPKHQQHQRPHLTRNRGRQDRFRIRYKRHWVHFKLQLQESDCCAALKSLASYQYVTQDGIHPRYI